MAVNVKGKFRETRTYSCDILYKEVAKEEVHTTFDNRLVVSKEAVKLLPPDIANSRTLLRYFLYGCGNKERHIPPEALHKGVWAIASGDNYPYVTNSACLFFKAEGRNVPDDHPQRFLSVGQALEWFDTWCKSEGDVGLKCWILHDGKVVAALELAFTTVPISLVPEDED